MIAFLFSSLGVALSGTVAPGPVTAATLAHGTLRRHAGFLIGLGHITVEFLTVMLLLAGVEILANSIGVRQAIGTAGGALLLVMGVQLITRRENLEASRKTRHGRHPYLTGVVLTCLNPYFLLWWVTVGVTILLQATQHGLLVLASFMVGHWACDLAWLEFLSQLGFRGVRRLGDKSRRCVSLFCGVALIVFGVQFLIDALLA